MTRIIAVLKFDCSAKCIHSSKCRHSVTRVTRDHNPPLSMSKIGNEITIVCRNWYNGEDNDK